MKKNFSYILTKNISGHNKKKIPIRKILSEKFWGRMQFSAL